ncbi:SPI-2 type III secretion system translocon protein SseB [Salmonella enterica]|nr:SPI-2 type III secretion system translocon protein SseB [Salmonella enterica]
MSSGNIFWGNQSQSHITVRNNFGISNFDTGGQDDLSQRNPFAEGYDVLTFLLMVIQAIANDKFMEIQKNSERARDSQEKSNEMDEVIAKAAQEKDPKTKEPVPEDVIDYMRRYGITVDGKTIDDYMAEFGDHGKLDKGGLQAVKASLDNDANRNTDMMSQQQLIIQKMSQQLNAVITQLTSLISKWGEISSMIAQKTYS